MKIDLYRKVMLIMSMLSFILLLIISIKIGVFAGFSTCFVLKMFESIIKNTYVSSILCSIIAVLIIYIIQVRYSKKMLKKDFRCNEIIVDLYDGIEAYCKIMDKIPERTESKSNEDVKEQIKKDATKFYEFYKENKVDVDLITLSLSYQNNDLLIDSVQSCFFINLNFKLLNIVNNIKNRLPNLRDGYPEIERIYEKYELEKGEDELRNLEYRLSSYFIDLRFMAIYWKDLLDYLEYDPIYIKMFIKIYRSKYDFEEDIKQPVEIRSLRAKKVDMEVKKLIIKNKIMNFWKK